MKNYFILVAAIVIIVFAGAGEYLSNAGYLSIGEGNQSITDMANRNLSVPSPINHVLSTSPSTTIIVYMVAPDKLLAFNYQTTSEEQSLIPDKYKSLGSVGGWYGTQTGSYEQFIAMSPDVIFDSFTPSGSGSTDSGTLDTINQRQQQFGQIPDVAVADTSNISSTNPSIEFIGKLLGSADKAKKLTDFNTNMQNQVTGVVSNMSQSDKVTVYYAHGTSGLETAASGSVHSQLIDLCGGINVANISDEGMWASVSMEQILQWNPEVIITSDPTFYANIYSNSSWSGITAVKNKRVYLSPQAPFKWFDQPVGANMIMGIPWTAKILYPDKFKSLNLTKETKEFYSEFYHYDLSDEDVNKILTSSGMNSTMLN